MRYYKRQIRRFKCPACGGIVEYPKRIGRRTPDGHVKTAWCPICRQTRDLVQISWEKG